jgi:hypothetical protein
MCRFEILSIRLILSKQNSLPTTLLNMLKKQILNSVLPIFIAQNSPT